MKTGGKSGTINPFSKEGNKEKEVESDEDFEIEENSIESEDEFVPGGSASKKKTKKQTKSKVVVKEVKKVVKLERFIAPPSRNRNNGIESWNWWSKYGVKPSNKFMSLPLDLFVLVCNHLNGKDLLILCQVSTFFRNFLHNPDNKDVWIRIGRRDELPDLVSGVDEVTYAKLMYLENCFFCGAKGTARVKEYNPLSRRQNDAIIGRKGITTIFEFQQKICVDCVSKEVMLVGESIDNNFPYHPLSTNCCPEASLFYGVTRLEDDDFRGALITIPGRNVSLNWSKNRYFPRKDLDSASNELMRLQAEDEEEMRISGTAPTISKVRAYVADKFEWKFRVSHDGSQLESIYKELRKLSGKLRGEKEAERLRLVALRKEEMKEKAKKLGYTEADLRDSKWGRGRDLIDWAVNLPEPMTEQDFQTCKLELLLSEAKVVRLELELKERQRQRQESIKPFFKKFFDSHLDSNAKATLPHLTNFIHLPSIIHFWKEDNIKLDNESWLAQLPKMFKDVEVYREKIRIETIKLILVANNEEEEEEQVSPSKSQQKKKSNEGEICSATEFDNSFFTASTSILACDLCPKDYHKLYYDYYPSMLLHQHEIHYDQRLKLEPNKDWKTGYSISKKQVQVLKHLLEVAGVDENSVGLEEIESMGLRFTSKEMYGSGSATEMMHFASSSANIKKTGQKFKDVFTLIT